MYEIDIQTRTLYAELLELLKQMEASRTIASLKGSFTVRENKGGEYVYFQTYAPSGRLQQVYVGPKNEKTEQLISEYAEGKPDEQEMAEKLKRLSAQIQAGARVSFDKSMLRVIRCLADSGVFRNGGMLVGTNAFHAAGLMLGVSWAADSTRTSDVDLAIERKISIAVPVLDTDIPAVLDSLKMGFFAVPRLNSKDPSTNFAIRNSQLRLDVLTPKTQDSDKPIYIKRFNCAADPLSYLSYVMVSPVPAVLLDARPVLVQIPQPVRYALHKLIVSQVRDVSNDTKRPKDLKQAHQILSVLKENRPDDIPPAWEDLVRRGHTWKNTAMAGLKAMEKLYGGLDLQFEVL